VRQVGYLSELYEKARSENKLHVLLGTLSPVTVVPELQTPADFHMWSESRPNARSPTDHDKQQVWSDMIDTEHISIHICTKSF